MRCIFVFLFCSVFCTSLLSAEGQRSISFEEMSFCSEYPDFISMKRQRRKLRKQINRLKTKRQNTSTDAFKKLSKKLKKKRKLNSAVKSCACVNDFRSNYQFLNTKVKNYCERNYLQEALLQVGPNKSCLSDTSEVAAFESTKSHFYPTVGEDNVYTLYLRGSRDRAVVKNISLRGDGSYKYLSSSTCKEGTPIGCYCRYFIQFNTGVTRTQDVELITTVTDNNKRQKTVVHTLSSHPKIKEQPSTNGPTQCTNGSKISGKFLADSRFPETEVGKSSILKIPFQSTGADSKITFLNVGAGANQAFELLSGSSCRKSKQPNCGCNLEIKFSPKKSGNSYGHVHVRVTDRDGQSANITQTLFGVASKTVIAAPPTTGGNPGDDEQSCDVEPKYVDLLRLKTNGLPSSAISNELNRLLPAKGDINLQKVFDDVNARNKQWRNSVLMNNHPLTGVAWETATAGTAISGLYVVQAQHLRNNSVIFYDNAGNRIERHIVKRYTLSNDSGFHHNDLDLTIGKLNKCLPKSITRYALPKINVSGRSFHHYLNGTELISTHWAHGKRELGIHRVAMYYRSPELTMMYGKDSGIISNMSRIARGGDSGHPIFALIEGQLVLFGVHNYGSYGVYANFFGSSGFAKGIKLAVETLEKD